MFQWQTSGKERGRDHPRPGITLLPAERCCICPDAEPPSIGGESPQNVASISLNHAAEPTGSWGFPGATSLPLLVLEENTFSNPKPHPCHDAPSLPSHPGCGYSPPTARGLLAAAAPGKSRQLFLRCCTNAVNHLWHVNV